MKWIRNLIARLRRPKVDPKSCFEPPKCRRTGCDAAGRWRPMLFLFDKDGDRWTHELELYVCEEHTWEMRGETDADRWFMTDELWAHLEAEALKEDFVAIRGHTVVGWRRILN